MRDKPKLPIHLCGHLSVRLVRTPQSIPLGTRIPRYGGINQTVVVHRHLTVKEIHRRDMMTEDRWSQRDTKKDD